MSTRYSSFKRWRALMLLGAGLMLVAIGAAAVAVVRWKNRKR